ncbi:MAG TPA: PadR family transcriptional regulator [Solirubrobacteraceae bacterium]|nr:PadR family transcriptional regulator [Solirubrobacteraceae bacterium]
MSRGELTPTSYVVLALVGREGAAPHDLATMMRRSPLYWTAAPSQYYSEPKRLRSLGYLASRKEPGRTKPRTVYTLTDRGLEALRRWLAQPADFPRIQNEAAIRLLAGDLVDDEAIVGSLRGLSERIAELSEALENAERVAESIPHRARYLHLCHWLGRRLLEVHQEWVETVERELQPTGPAQAAHDHASHGVAEGPGHRSQRNARR